MRTNRRPDGIRRDGVRPGQPALLAFSGWVILQTIVIWIGLALYTWPGLILSLVLVYIPLAAIAGRGNALGENFRAIGAHPIRWIITGLIISVFLLLGFLLGAVNTFFIGGPVATFAAVFVGGLFGWWWLTTWALLFRSRVEPARPGPGSRRFDASPDTSR